MPFKLIAAYLRLVRPQNLLLVVLTQFMLMYVVLVPNYRLAGVEAQLSNLQFTLISLVSILALAFGNVINDIADVEIDKINKPHRLIVTRIISIKSAALFAGLLAIFGALGTLIITIQLGEPICMLVYLFAIFSLYIYSKKYKLTAFWGNVLVSINILFVLGSIWFAEAKSISELLKIESMNFQLIRYFFPAYLAFSGISNLFREIVKDLEDVEGDESGGANTLPIRYGKKIARFIGNLVALSLLILLFLSVYFLIKTSIVHALILSLFTILPTVLSLYYFNQSTATSNDYHKSSNLIKLTMLGGLLMILVLF